MTPLGLRWSATSIMEDMENKIVVTAKAQNRQALGIMHAYMTMFPNTTLEELREAFPNTINPDKGTDEIFIPAEEKGTTANWDGYFKGDGELLTMGDGMQVSVVKMWTKPSLERLVEHAKQYGIKVVPSETNVDDKTKFHIEAINKSSSFETAEVKKQSNNLMKWLLLAGCIVAIILIIWFLVK